MDDGYIQELSQEEKIIFLKMFCVLIKADGEIDAEEISFLKMVAKRFNIDDQAVLQIIKNTNPDIYMPEAKKIRSRTHALELLKELCFLANIDDNLHDAELDFIVSLARMMGIEDEKLILINRFVLDTLILNKTGRIILEKENG